MIKILLFHCSILCSIIMLSACSNSHIITESDKDWLVQHPNLTVGISPNAPPYQFVDKDGKVSGIFIDFLDYIESDLDYKFQRVYQSDFSKLLADSKNGLVDVLLEVQKTDEREQFLNFTPPLMSHSHVIVVRNSEQGISSIDDLNGRNISVVNSYAVQEYLTKNYPHLKLIPGIDDLTCLRLVSTGQSDAFICQQAVAIYYIESKGILNLKIVGEINYDNELAIATRKNQDTLHLILSKVVNSLSKKAKEEMYHKWLSYAVKPFYLEAKFLISLGLSLLFIIVLVVMFNFALRKSVIRKTLELKVAKDRAEESDRLKSAFLANMSHEIRTPMNGILGFAELLKEPGLSGEVQSEYIKIIEKSGARMLNTINDIVDISKIEAGLMKLDIKELNVNEKMEYIFTFFKPEAEAKGMKLSIRNSLSSKEATIQTDSEKLYAILTNLVKNAIKYAEKGSIEFGYDLVDINSLAYLQFYVKDTGIGIPKDRQQAIFERFIQAEIEDKMARQGSGLGLAITKSYVEMLGGKMWVESEEGVGSTFYLTLPFHTASSKQVIDEGTGSLPSAGKATNPFLPRLKILLVDDEETSRMFLSIVTKDLSEKVFEAINGLEAVERCRNNPDIDLILMDIQMPEMGGHEATRLIRQFNKEVVIIAQTAFGLSGDKEKAIEAGCNDHISKPIKSAELHDLIKKYFKKKF